MGTRHLICVFWKGKWVLAQYGQWDGYPEGQGVKLFRFLSVARNIEDLKAGLENHIYEPSEEKFVAIDAECRAWDENLRQQQQPPPQAPWKRSMHGMAQLYPSLSRDTSAGILAMIARAASQSGVEDGAESGGEKEAKKVPVKLELGFANDGLFCEWAYVIDLDNEVLEVFGGSEHKHDGHRFVDVGGKDDTVPAFVCSFAFSDLYLMKDNEEFLYRVMTVIDKQAEEQSEDDEEDEVREADEGDEDEGERQEEIAVEGEEKDAA